MEGDQLLQKLVEEGNLGGLPLSQKSKDIQDFNLPNGKGHSLQEVGEEGEGHLLNHERKSQVPAD